jgi:hypothetical protein
MLRMFWKEAVDSGTDVKLTKKEEDDVANKILLFEINFLIVSSTLSLGFLFQFLFIPSSIWTECLCSANLETPFIFIIQYYG